MQFIPDWKWRAPRLTSVQLAVLSAVLSAVEFALPFVAPEKPSGYFAAAAVVVSIGAALARLVQQPKARRESRRDRR